MAFHILINMQNDKPNIDVFLFWEHAKDRLWIICYYNQKLTFDHQCKKTVLLIDIWYPESPSEAKARTMKLCFESSVDLIVRHFVGNVLGLNITSLSTLITGFKAIASTPRTPSITWFSSILFVSRYSIVMK